MDGGGHRQGIDADLIAWAVIASARVYGDDPIEAMTGGTSKRRALAPAAQALGDVFDLTDRAAEQLLGLGIGALSRRRDAPTRSEFLIAAGEAEKTVRSILARRGLFRRPVARSAVAAEISQPPPNLPIAAPPARTVTTKPVFVGPVGAAVLEVLDNAAATPMALATILSAKEAVIGQTLSLLRHLGLVEADPLGEAGVRGQLWRRTSKAAGEAA